MNLLLESSSVCLIVCKIKACSPSPNNLFHVLKIYEAIIAVLAQHHVMRPIRLYLEKLFCMWKTFRLPIVHISCTRTSMPLCITLQVVPLCVLCPRASEFSVSGQDGGGERIPNLAAPFISS